LNETIMHVDANIMDNIQLLAYDNNNLIFNMP
jgi:hypothetical protein